MKRFLESLLIFAFVLAIWTLLAAALAATLQSFLPIEEKFEFVGGAVVTLGLLVAVGTAARLVRGRLAASSH